VTTPSGQRGAPLAREVRLLVADALGSWHRVLQLALLMVVAAGLLVVVMAAAGDGGSWLASVLEPLVRAIPPEAASPNP
jgi:hypothetical protein